MHDYQLERLNTRSFEQLVQSLSLQIIGNQLMIFGDGPDGGREATFNGLTKFPDGGRPWSGFGIVQAKFRQIPETQAKKNADWVITQLRAEFSKLTPHQNLKKTPEYGERCCPEYYIFATNLRLSSVAKEGGKDRVSEVLDGFKVSHGLKDWAIWDGDQICRFLDAQPAIRCTYAAWIVPGDVISKMIKYLELEETEFNSTLQRYLEIELLDEQYAKLGQGGYTDANAIPLSNVFVDLPVDRLNERELFLRNRPQFALGTSSAGLGDDESDNSGTRRHTFLELLFEESRQVLKPSANPRKQNENISSRRTAGRIVLIGGPGQGKTTLGQFACQLLRAEILKRTCANFSPEVEQALSRIDEQSQNLPKLNVLRYPIRIDLKRLAEALAGEGEFPANSVLDFLVKYVSKRTDSQLRKSEFRTWLKGYPWVLVLDGLDEVPPSSNRTKMMDAIRNFVSVESHQMDADLLILATTRPQGYSEEFDPDFYSHLPLSPLNAFEALEYGAKLAQARHPGLKSRIEELTNSLKRATTNSATVRLMESPLQVTIMLALIEGGGEPPEQRWKLFNDYYDVIYRREKERGTPFSSLLGKYEPDIHWLHHRAGWILQQRNANAGTTAARLTHEEFETLVDRRLIRRGHSDSVKRELLVGQIRDAATDRLVFLVGNTASEIGFEIRSLQEFMASEHCFDGPESCVQETVKAIAPHSYWRNVFLFSSGRIFFKEECLIDTLVAVCERLNESLTDQSSGITLVGSRLAVAMLRDGVSRNQPENCRVLARCAARVLDAIRVEEIVELVPLFSGDAGEVWEDELSKRLRSTSREFPLISWRLCLELVASDNDFAIELMESQFPWRHEEVESLLRGFADNSARVPDKFWKIFRNYILFHSPLLWIRLFPDRTKVPDSLKCDVILQILSLYHNQDRDQSSILDNLGNPTLNSLIFIGGKKLQQWACLVVPVSDPSEIRREWLILHYVSEFARTYTASSLAEQFATIVDLDPLISSDSLGAYQFPWQIQVCLAAKDAGFLLKRITTAVSAGSLGDTSDWSHWDHRFRNGVNMSELGYRKGPVSVSNDCFGPIFSRCSWSQGQGGEYKILKVLTQSLHLLNARSGVVKVLVNLCGFGLGECSAVGRFDYTAVENFIIRCNQCEVQLAREFIVAIIRSPIRPELKGKLLGLIGLNVNPLSYLYSWEEGAVEVDKASREIVELVCKRTGSADVLIALSFLPPLPFAKIIPPSALQECRENGVNHQFAAEILEICTLGWKLPAEEIARQVFNLREHYPRFLDEFLDFLDVRSVTSPEVEAFVIAVMRSAESFGSAPLRNRSFDLLGKLVERRPAVEELPDPSEPKRA